MKKFIQKFIEEATEIISLLETAILQLESDPDDASIIEEVFRSMHTIKGGGAMFGFEKIRDITHELENYFDIIRESSSKVTKDVLDITLESIDFIKDILEEGSEDNVDTKTYEKLLEKVTQLTELDKESINSNNEDEAKENNDSTDNNNTEPEIKTYHIYFKPHKNILKNGTDPLLILNELVELGESKIIAITSDLPDIADLVLDELHIAWNIILATDKEEEINDAFIFVEDDAKIAIKEIESGNAFKNMDYINSIERFFGDNILESNQTVVEENNSEIEISSDETYEEIENTEDLTKSEESNLEPEVKIYQVEEEETEEEESIEGLLIEKTSTSKVKKTASQNAISSIRISSDKVDMLMNLVSELITTQARLNLYAENQNNPELFAIAENVQKLSRQLRDNAFDLSIIPLQTIVVRFHRLVRDLSSELNKEIDFVTEGTSTELDKSIIENLTDPLLHILRNSIDHGIEDAETRRKLGKPEKGTISLNAFYSGANVHIQISDDGKGIDPEKIREKAIRKGIISSTKHYSKKELLDLIFIPGFSTNEQVTDISGRGVGMDVVKRKISQIRGILEVDSTPDVGTHIIIKLPLTLSIIDGLLIQIDTTNYIIPLGVVNKIYPIRHEELSDSFYNVLVLDGKQIPYYYLREEFGSDKHVPKYEQVIVVGFGDVQIGIVVDKVIGEYQAVLKPLGKHYNKIQIFSGATILGDGTVALVMDTNQIINKFSTELSNNQ